LTRTALTTCTALLLPCLLPLARADAADAPAPSALSATPRATAAWSHWLFAAQEYRFRTSASTLGAGGALTDPAPPDEQDQDLRLLLDGGLRHPEDRFVADLAMGLWWDVDGHARRGETAALASMRDDAPARLEVYALKGELRLGQRLERLRLGRQSAPYGRAATFDGASGEIVILPRALRLFAFGGRTVHFFEADASRFEDWLGSVGVTARTGPDTKVELDYRFLQEEVSEPGGASRSGVLNHTYGLRGQLRHGEWLRMRASLRGIDTRLANMALGAIATLSEASAGASVDLDAQTVTLREVNERDDPYYAVLGRGPPNLKWRLDLWKALETASGTFAVHAGWNGRQIVAADEAPLARSSGRLYVEARADDLGTRGPFLRASLESHFAGWDPTCDGLFAPSLSAGFTAPRFDAEVGTYYQRFKYDYYRDVREVASVRTTFAGGSFKPLRWLRLRARYVFERFDRDLHAVYLTASQVL